MGRDDETVIPNFTGQWWNDGTRWAETLKLGAAGPPRHTSTTCCFIFLYVVMHLSVLLHSLVFRAVLSHGLLFLSPQIWASKIEGPSPMDEPLQQVCMNDFNFTTRAYT